MLSTSELWDVNVHVAAKVGTSCQAAGQSDCTVLRTGLGNVNFESQGEGRWALLYGGHQTGRECPAGTGLPMRRQ